MSLVCACMCVYACVMWECVPKAQWRVAVKFVDGVLAGPHADFLCSAMGSIVSLKDRIVPSLGPLSL